MTWKLICMAFLVGRNVLKMLQKRKPLKQMKPQSLWCTVPFQRFWGPGPHFHPHGRGAASAAVKLSSLLGLGSGVLDSFSWFSPLKRCSSAVAQSSMTSLRNQNKWGRVFWRVCGEWASSWGNLIWKWWFFSFLKFIFGHGDVHRKLRWTRIELNDSPSKWGYKNIPIQKRWVCWNGLSFWLN